jgi:ubiquinone/menaquinone biosynthesis C-methylase UbiE
MKINYDNISKTYDNYRSYAPSQTSPLIKFGNVEPGLKILDLGCGTGNLSRQLLDDIRVDTIGLDKSLNMLAKARNKALPVLCADAELSPLPFKDNSFDRVILSFVIHHIKNRLDLIKECYRILNGGALILVTSSHEQIEGTHPVIKEFFPSLIEADKRRFPEIPELDNFLHRAGFKDIRHEELVVSKISIDREYLEKVRNKFISTFYLLSDDEFQAGVEKLERFIENIREPVFREWRGTMIYGKKL